MNTVVSEYQTFKIRTFWCLVIERLNHLKTGQNGLDFKYIYQLVYKTIIKHTHNSDPNSDKDLQIN